MIILAALVSLVLLSALALHARRSGQSGTLVAMIFGGAVGIVVLLFAILSWGFSGFG